MKLALFLSVLLPSQVDEAIPPTPHDRVFELELTAEDPELIEGRGPTVVAEYEVEFDGFVHLWAHSELDLHLRVEDPGTGGELGESQAVDRPETPFVRLRVAEGDYLVILVAGLASEAPAAIELHVAASVDSPAALEGLRAADQRIAAAQRALAEGDPASARESLSDALELLSAPSLLYSDRGPRLLFDLSDLSEVAGDLDTTLEARRLGRSYMKRALPADHRDALTSDMNLANALFFVGDLDGSRALLESVVTELERVLSPDDRSLLLARGNLAAVCKNLGDLAGALAMEEAVLAAYARNLPADHPDVLSLQSNLAVTRTEMGDLVGARELGELVLAAYERTLPEDHPKVLSARGNLAVQIRDLGELDRCRALLESVVASYERTLPADHPDLLRARLGLAGAFYDMGDSSGARLLYESAAAGFERIYPPDHPDLLAAREGLGIAMEATGDLAGARALFESVVARGDVTRESKLRAKSNLAVMMDRMGERDEAALLLREVARLQEETLPPEHPELLLTRMTLAKTMRDGGDLSSARELLELVLAAHERRRSGARQMIPVRMFLGDTLLALGEASEVARLAYLQAAALREVCLRFMTLSPRGAREAILYETRHLERLLAWTRGADATLRAAVFEVQETMRMVVGESPRVLRASADAQVAGLLRQAGEIRAKLSGLGPGEDAELTRLIQARDRLEREASKVLAARDIPVGPVEVGRLSAALPDNAAWISYRRLGGLVAHVLESDGSLVRVDLGDAGEIAGLVARWRPTVAASGARGLALPDNTAHSEPSEALGESLRQRLLDPLLDELSSSTTRIYVCVDDFLYLIPLDALPYGEGCVGDRWTIVNEVSVAGLLGERERESARSGLLVLGDVSYGATEEEAAPRVALRSQLTESFAQLPQTAIEVRSIARLHEDQFDAATRVLTRGEASREALFREAAGRRYLHLATHGWFASDSVKSTLDEERDGRDWTRMGLQARVTGMAPMLLCGLALARANEPPDSLGRRPGILTAEELCSLDLTDCELAVLSACETNVGIRRAGQGIQSLQAALYAAGARSSITSLWKVDDAATRRLMELFYANLWEAKMPKARALWEAKRVLREEGAPLRDWAGWVLTGDPD